MPWPPFPAPSGPYRWGPCAAVSPAAATGGWTRPTARQRPEEQNGFERWPSVSGAGGPKVSANLLRAHADRFLGSALRHSDGSHRMMVTGGDLDVVVWADRGTCLQPRRRHRKQRLCHEFVAIQVLYNVARTSFAPRCIANRPEHGCACWLSAFYASTVIPPICRTLRCRRCYSRPRFFPRYGSPAISTDDRLNRLGNCGDCWAEVRPRWRRQML